MRRSIAAALRARDGSRAFASWRRIPMYEAEEENVENPHYPDSYLGVEGRKVVAVDQELCREYKCSPTVLDVKFINTMISILRNGAITWWEAAGVLNKYGIQLRPFHICEILKKNIDSDAALGLFRWAEAQPGYNHDTLSYNRMLRTLGDDLNLKHLACLLKEMDRKSIRRTYDTYMVVVVSYFNGGMVDKALQTFFEFERSVRPKPKKKYYVYVLKRLLDFKRHDSVPIVVKNMLQVGHVADTETFNQVILGLGSAGKVNDAVDLSRQMVKQGCVPDVNTYVYLVTGLVKAGSFERAADVIADMAASGCKPNAHNFNLLLGFLLSSERAVETLVLVKQMVVAGFELFCESCKLLAKFFEEQGDARMAFKFYDELAEADIYPDLLAYTSLLRMLNAADMVEEAIKVYNVMKGDGCCRPDRDANNIVLHVLCKAGRMDEALDVFKEMDRAGAEAETKPNKVTYDVLLTGLAVDDRLPECLKVFKQMEANKFSPDRETYVCLIGAFSKGGLHEQAFRLFGRMKLEGFEPSVEMHNAILKKRRRDMEAQRKLELQQQSRHRNEAS